MLPHQDANLLQITGALATAAIIAGCSNNPIKPLIMKPFRYCLNTSTIREKNIGIEAEIDVATNAGYSRIEPWIRTIRAYMEVGVTQRPS